ncbi:PAS domain-containing methyl-accepting chemotaxis protein [Pseudomonas sp. NW5]|uniref:methyl-accepting chemotaxis protein n=1 Tax=Pseudomonas sp. NW5 TaxID=2934934 RepID=UPI0020210738|nr:PAS domain-containing methyl-accepting chemotaxis protein [Pseudomonas sp. NW5]MCL7461888.1 methyl-accepting chemotaxis protein [Pseudomonas sp. NW5]
MRINQPVTQREYELQDDDFLISRTDLKGVITYANPAFVKVSGFTHEELIGENHNLVRHPDMPPVAFANLWSTVEAGHSWNGYVKNRRKNGDHYWVRANVTPYYENGRLAGYASVRVRPSREEVARHDAAYREIMAGRGKHLTLDRGQLVQRGLPGLLAKLSRVSSLRGRLTVMAGSSILLLLLSGLIGHLGQQPGASAAYPYLQMGLVVIGLLLLGMLGYSTARSVNRPLQASLDFTAQLAAGNLSSSMPDFGDHELGKMTRLLETMRKSLTSIATDVNAGIDTFSHSANEIARGNENLASRTEQQAASLQETAASMEELTGTVQQNTANARQASQLAGDASSTVRDSGHVMHQVVDTMGEITATSRKMTEIINVIDSIAFQTNILALNASVEAARAGEQGRGFAVVASEVRNLATRSAAAAKEIRSLIDSSSRQIDAGAEMVRTAEQRIESVVAAVTRVNDIMGEIAAASDEQSHGISQINQAVAQMDDVTQQNAGLVQSAAQVAKRLEDQVAEVERAISIFCLRSGSSNGSGRAAAASGAAAQTTASRTTTPARTTTSRPAVAHREQEPAAPVAKGNSGTSASGRTVPVVDEWESF